MNHPSDPLPLLPAELLRRYSCAEPTDTRFRAIARLRQSLWREQHGYRLRPLPGRQRPLAPPRQPRQLSRRPDRRQPGRPHPDPPRPARDRLSRGRRCHPRRASLDQPAGQPGPDLQSLRPVQATPGAGHGRDAPAGPRSGRRGDRGAVRALARTRPSRLHRRPHRLRRADPLHDTAGAATPLSRSRSSTRRHPPASPHPAGPATTHCRAPPASSAIPTHPPCATRRSNSSGVSSCSSPRCSSAATITMAACS